MYINSFQHLVLVFIVFGIGIQPSKTQHVPPEQCATGVHAILLRGQGPGDHLNVMVSLQNLILQLIPGSSSVALPYKHGDDDHRLAGANGAIMMQQYIRFYVASCPKSKIYLHGYSLGGVAMMDGLCGTSSQWLLPVPALEPMYNQNVIAAVSYGEETFVPGQPWNVGNCVDGTGGFSDDRETPSHSFLTLNWGENETIDLSAHTPRDLCSICIVTSKLL